MAGWIVAAIYLVCVVAPPAALALGGGPAPCFAEATLPIARADGHGDSHRAIHAHHPLADDGAPDERHHHDDKSGPCCVMLCAVAIPAKLPTIAEPSQPASSRIAEVDRSMTGRTPPLLYRPPIA